MHILAVAIGGAVGATLRWLLGLILNPLFPTIPLGTLAANLTGGLLIGMMLGIIKVFPLFPDMLRLGIITGFLGGLTTFSTFSAETVHLIADKTYAYALLMIAAHVAGSLSMTVLGLFIIKSLARVL